MDNYNFKQRLMKRPFNNLTRQEIYLPVTPAFLNYPVTKQNTLLVLCDM